MSKEFTHGTWRYSERTAQVNAYGGAVLRICDLSVHHGGKTCAADGRLIAAAPDLLAVLREGMDLITDPMTEPFAKWFANATAAIVKAQGQS